MIEIALIAWFPVTAVMFIMLKPHIAAATSMIFGMALLPALRAIPVPVMPDLSQFTVPVIACLIMAVVRCRERLVAARPGMGAEALIAVMIVGALVTNLTNTDPQVFGANVLPGMTVLDTVNDGLRMIFRWAVPFLLGRALVRTGKEATEVLVILAITGLFYVPFILVEFQTGPLFHLIVYGSHPDPSTFWHSARYGGFRPNVLMNHGLTLSVFMFHCVLAWVGLARMGVKPFRIPATPAAFFMVVIAGFFKTRSVFVYAAMTIPLILFARPRMQLLAAMVLSGVILFYPFLRSLDLVPVDTVAEIAEEYGGYSAVKSFQQRIDTEDEILGRTSERYFFGWGGYSRYWTYDPVTGAPLSVMDGFWVIIFGQGGLFRFLTLFSFLLYPVVYAWRRIDRVPALASQRVVCVLAWIVVIRTLNLLPNAMIDPWHVFFGGAICGVVKYESERRRPKRPPAAPVLDAKPVEVPPSGPTGSLGANLVGPPTPKE